MSTASAEAAASRVRDTGLRLVRLRERLERLQRGEPCTPDDVTSAKRWADAQAQSLAVAIDRLTLMQVSTGGRTTPGVPDDAEPATPADTQAEAPAEVAPAPRELAVLREGIASLLAWPGAGDPDEGRQRGQWCEAVVALTRSAEWRGWGDAVCSTLVALFPEVRGAAICAVAGSRAQVTAASDDWTHALQEMEVIVGEGPTTTARQNAAITVVGDLGAERSAWQGFASASSGHEVHAVTAAPLLVQGKAVGCLTLYGHPGDTGELLDLGAVRIFADIAATGLRADIGNASLETGVEGEPFSFYVATGVTDARLGITTDEAECLLRAHAFGAGWSLAQVAAQVLAGDDPA